MAEARQRAEWCQTSALMALLANCHRDPKKSPVKPADFNPFATRTKAPKVGVGILKDIFINKGKTPRKEK